MADLMKMLQNRKVSVPESGTKRKSKQVSIHYEKLVESKYQYRKLTVERVASLADMIQADGQVLQPLLVRKISGDLYEIIAGHRRYRACKYLTEELNQKGYEMLPCHVIEANDIKTEFAVYSTNFSFDQKSEAEKMDEVLALKRLIETYPEEFEPESGKRIVEKVANIIGIGKSQVIEYNSIQNNLSDKAMQVFRSGEINKSSAATLSKLEKEKQDQIVKPGITAKEIQSIVQNQQSVPESGTAERIEKETESNQKLPCSIKRTQGSMVQFRSYQATIGSRMEWIHYIDTGTGFYLWTDKSKRVCHIFKECSDVFIKSLVHGELNLQDQVVDMLVDEILFANKVKKNTEECAVISSK